MCTNSHVSFYAENFQCFFHSVVLQGTYVKMPFVCIVSLFALQTRLYAALVLGEFTNAYLFSGNIPSGTNAVVEVIHRSFLARWCFTNRLPLVNTHCCTAAALQNSSCIHRYSIQELGFSNMITRASRCYPFYTLSYEVKQS